MSHHDTLAEKHVVQKKVVDSPASETDLGIIKDWDGEESAVRRKYVHYEDARCISKFRFIHDSDC